MDMERGDIIRGIYDKAWPRATCAGEREGYDMIILNDTVLGFGDDLKDKRLGMRAK